MNYYAPESSFFPPESEECDFCGEHFSECHCFDGMEPDFDAMNDNNSNREE